MGMLITVLQVRLWQLVALDVDVGCVACKFHSTDLPLWLAVVPLC
jgi:hypothetical protein